MGGGQVRLGVLKTRQAGNGGGDRLGWKGEKIMKGKGWLEGGSGQDRLGWSKRISQVVRQSGLAKAMEGNLRLVGGTGEREVRREGLM